MLLYVNGVQINLNAKFLSRYCGFFLYVRTVEVVARLNEFPGGAMCLKHVSDYLSAYADDADSLVTMVPPTEVRAAHMEELIATVGFAELVKSGVILQSPALLRDVTMSKYANSVPPRVAHVMLRMLFCLPPVDSAPSIRTNAMMQLRMHHFETSMKEAELGLIRQLALALRVDDGVPQDLCCGHVRGWVALLQTLQGKARGTFDFLSRLWEDVEPGVRLKQHLFVVGCMVHHVRRLMHAGSGDDICDAILEQCGEWVDGLVPLCRLVPYLDMDDALPKVLAAVLVYALYCAGDLVAAKALYCKSLPQALGPFERLFHQQLLPPSLLVAGEKKAAVCILKGLLSRYDQLEPATLHSLIETTLLEDFGEVECAVADILADPLLADLVTFLRTIAHSPADTLSTPSLALALDPWVPVPHKKNPKYMQLSILLFRRAFVAQNGFPTHMWRNGILDMHLLQCVHAGPETLAIVRRIVMDHLALLPRETRCVGCFNLPKWEHFNTIFALGRWGEGGESSVLAALDCLLAFAAPLCDVHGQAMFPKFALDVSVLPVASILSRFPPQIVACHLASVHPDQRTVVNHLQDAVKKETDDLVMLKAEVQAIRAQLDAIETNTEYVRTTLNVVQLKSRIN